MFGRPEITTNDFFDYEAKYEGKSKEITPANISEIQKKNVTELSKKIYKKLINIYYWDNYNVKKTFCQRI